MTILKDHIPIITFLRPGIIKVFGSKEIESFLLKKELWNFQIIHLIILSSTIIDVKNLSLKIKDL